MGYYKKIIQNINDTFSSYKNAQKKFIESIGTTDHVDKYIGNFQERTLSAKFCMDNNSFIPEFPIKRNILDLIENADNINLSLSKINYIDSLLFDNENEEFEIFEFKFESFSNTKGVNEILDKENNYSKISKTKVPIFDVIRSVCFMSVCPLIRKSVFVYWKGKKEKLSNKIDNDIEDTLITLDSEEIFKIIFEEDNDICAISNKISEIIIKKEREISSLNKNNIFIFLIENKYIGKSNVENFKKVYITEKVEEYLTNINRLKSHKRKMKEDRFLEFSKNVIEDYANNNFQLSKADCFYERKDKKNLEEYNAPYYTVFNRTGKNKKVKDSVQCSAFLKICRDKQFIENLQKIKGFLQSIEYNLNDKNKIQDDVLKELILAKENVNNKEYIFDISHEINNFLEKRIDNAQNAINERSTMPNEYTQIAFDKSSSNIVWYINNFIYLSLKLNYIKINQDDGLYSYFEKYSIKNRDGNENVNMDIYKIGLKCYMVFTYFYEKYYSYIKYDSVIDIFNDDDFINLFKIVFDINVSNKKNSIDLWSTINYINNNDKISNAKEIIKYVERFCKPNMT